MNPPPAGPRPRRLPPGPGPFPRPALPALLAAVALGGGLGSAARYGAGRLWPTPAHAFPWTTLGVNVLGCALIGVLLTVVTAGPGPAHPLLRPFLGTGVLGGFTTFSAHSREAEALLSGGRPGPGAGYLALTLAAALLAVALTAAATRRVLARRAHRLDAEGERP
ncbi:CrcB family protein [Streptomyces sp. DSM 44917]|uniref:Fluoride-specific ion channel FluC n=1 Tax=Streptomyces boetiae TaxID=3075541 RepID=A0ABU2L7W8_9ACTN|nr:CrcB family protein [Streptomyces sp. DSM 44917]MDT0307432.1 CrcB family protein [Streptomyces sp. DSM 44917]